MGVGTNSLAGKRECKGPTVSERAIANATGVWIKDLPITPEKTLKAARQKRRVEESVPT